MFQARSSALWVLGVLNSCGQNEPAPVSAPMSEGALIQIGSQAIGTREIALVGKARGIDKDTAVAGLVRDALFAEAFLRQHPARAEFLRTSVLARRLTEEFAALALAQGPPSLAEVEQLTARNWWQMDRPVMTRTIHALVLLGRSRMPADRARARAMAERLSETLQGASSTDEFRGLAEGFGGEGLEIKVEALLPVAADGRVVDPKSPPPPGAEVETYVPEFAKAAAALTGVGAHSPVVETEFGFHVLRCTERLPALKLPLQARTEKLEQEVMDRRAQRLQESTLSRARANTQVEIETSAVTATEVLQVPR